MQHVIQICKDDKITHRNHKNDADDVSLIRRFSIVQEVLVNMRNGQRNGSHSANEGNNNIVKWD